MNKKMLPCPFCPDGIGILKDSYIQGIANRKTYWVECNKCQARIQNRRSAKRAVEAWNADYRCVQPENEPITNADRIRSMSDEELQKFLRKFESGDIDYAKTFCDLCCKDAALERRSVDCDGCLLWWLKNDAKQPQEGEGK